LVTQPHPLECSKHARTWAWSSNITHPTTRFLTPHVRWARVRRPLFLPRTPSGFPFLEYTRDPPLLASSNRSPHSLVLVSERSPRQTLRFTSAEERDAERGGGRAGPPGCRWPAIRGAHLPERLRPRRIPAARPRDGQLLRHLPVSSPSLSRERFALRFQLPCCGCGFGACRCTSGPLDQGWWNWNSAWKLELFFFSFFVLASGI
jgi:hypothetical protein